MELIVTESRLVAVRDGGWDVDKMGDGDQKVVLIINNDNCM